MAEALLIARLKVEHLLRDSRWDEAAAIGNAALRGAHAGSASALVRIAVLLADLGMLVDVNLTARCLCSAHAAGLPSPLARKAAEALKKLLGHDVDTWSGCITASAARPISLETLDAALRLLDSSTCRDFVAQHAFHSAIQRALCSADRGQRAAALQMLGSAVLTSPSLVVPLVPILTRAVFIEEPVLKQVALANLMDVVFMLARLPAAAVEDEGQPHDTSQRALLESLMQWLPNLLHAPEAGLQTLAALGLSNLVLHRVEQSLLCEAIDAEAIIAALSRRYTACDELSPLHSDKAPRPLPILLAFFEELKAKRQDDVGNTISWMVLEGLAGKAGLHEIDPDLHRSAKWLFTLVEAGSAEVVLSAVRLNAQLELGDHVDVRMDDVAAWLGTSCAS